MGKIDVHADDYALSLHSSKDIVELLKTHKLDSISVIPSMKCYEETMDLLRSEALMDIPVSVHLNFMEGKCCAEQDEVQMLVDENGYFKVTWGSLFLDSFKPEKRRELMVQLAKEITCQIEKVEASMPDDYKLRLDSHQHTHMIPVVRDAMLLAIDERSKQGEKPVTFVRLSKEPLKPFLKHMELYRDYSIMNLIKNVLLWMLSFPMEKQLKKRQIPYAHLCGLMLSGNMNVKCMEALYGDMVAYTEDKGCDMEILFHPGAVLESEISEENVQQGFVDFHLSDSRRSEYEAVEALHEM